MKDAPDENFSFQGDENEWAARNPQPDYSSQSGQEQGIEEMETPSLHPPEHLYEELHERSTDRIFVDGIQIKRQLQDTSSLSFSDIELLLLLLDPDFRVRESALHQAKNLMPPQFARLIAALQQTIEDPQKEARVAAFQQTLHNPLHDMRAVALRVLCTLNRSEQKNLLTHYALRDSAWRIRTTAVRELGWLDKEAPREVLLAALRDRDMSVKEAAIGALQPLAVWAWKEQQDGRLLDALAAALHDQNELVRATAAEAVGDFEEYIPRGELVKLLRDDPEELVRAAAAESLGKMGKYQPIRDLLLALHNDSSEIVRASIVQALENLREEIPTTPLLQVLHQDRSSLVRVAVIKSLEALGESMPIEVLKALILALKDRDEEVSEQAKISLSALYEQIYGGASLSFLLTLLQNENEHVYQLALWALEQLAQRSLPAPRETEPLYRAGIETYSSLNDQGEENALAQRLFLALINFVKEKKGYIKAEAKGEGVLVLKCYYQKEELSLQEAVLNQHSGASRYVQHLEKALKDNDDMICDIARHALRKRERRRWTETFLVSLDITRKQSYQPTNDIPARIIVCSIAYHEVYETDLAISACIDQYIKKRRQLPFYARACAWLERCKEPIFRYARGVSGIKVWYDSVTSPAHI